MNFLSHFYFEEITASPARVLGGVLPDLLKNADKTFLIKPNKFQTQLLNHPFQLDLLQGWNAHLEVDRLFHNSDFFFRHTAQLKQCVQPVLESLPIRPSFFAHIALELLLDHLLIQNHMLSVDKFYADLSGVDRAQLQDFLLLCELKDVDKFNVFFERFISARYIYAYHDISKVTQALLQICKRLWNFEIEPAEASLLNGILNQYANESLTDYLSIFQKIQMELAV